MTLRTRTLLRGFTLAASAGTVAGLLASGGCAKPLLSPDDERTQYARYDALRNQYAPQFVEDEFGRQRPNLRARLSPKD
ncbi:MAG: hypothetical protein ACKVS8_08635 [Phycisphaerales bacterium]